MWLVYLYLIREAFIDAYLLIEGGIAVVFLGAPPPDLPVLYILGLYAVVVAVNGGALIGWALYNQRRFRGRETRKAIAAVGPAELAAFHGCSPDQVTAWQQARTMTMSHGTDGRLVAVMREPLGLRRRSAGD